MLRPSPLTPTACTSASAVQAARDSASFNRPSESIGIEPSTCATGAPVAERSIGSAASREISRQ